jgi:hypothetical protein
MYFFVFYAYAFLYVTSHNCIRNRELLQTADGLFQPCFEKSDRPVFGSTVQGARICIADGGTPHPEFFARIYLNFWCY